MPKEAALPQRCGACGYSTTPNFPTIAVSLCNCLRDCMHVCNTVSKEAGKYVFVHVRTDVCVYVCMYACVHGMLWYVMQCIVM